MWSLWSFAGNIPIYARFLMPQLGTKISKSVPSNDYCTSWLYSEVKLTRLVGLFILHFTKNGTCNNTRVGTLLFITRNYWWCPYTFHTKYWPLGVVPIGIPKLEKTSKLIYIPHFAVAQLPILICIDCSGCICQSSHKIYRCIYRWCLVKDTSGDQPSLVKIGQYLGKLSCGNQWTNKIYK